MYEARRNFLRKTISIDAVMTYGLSHIGDMGKAFVLLPRELWTCMWMFCPLSSKVRNQHFKLNVFCTVFRCPSAAKHLWEKRLRQKITPSRNTGRQILDLSTRSLKLGWAPKGEELTMETVMAIYSSSQGNEKHIETSNISTGEAQWAPRWWNQPDNGAGSQGAFPASVFISTTGLYVKVPWNCWEITLGIPSFTSNRWMLGRVYPFALN